MRETPSTTGLPGWPGQTLTVPGDSGPGSGSGSPGGGLPPGGSGGVSEGDIIGLTAVGSQFGLAGVQAAHATEQLTLGPLRRPGMLLALAMAGHEGLDTLGRMHALAYARGPGSLAGAALALGGDGVVLETSAIRFMLADRGFLTDPLVTVPLSELERDPGGQRVVRTVSLQLSGDVTIHGANIGAGSTLLVEYLANGMVRIAVQRSISGGGEVRAGSGVSLTGEGVGGVSWLLANDREAARLAAALTAAGGVGLVTGTDALALAMAGAVPAIPRPQTWTVGQGATLDGSLGGDVTLLDGSVSGSGQVTFDELGNRTYALKLSGSASTALAERLLGSNVGEVAGDAGIEVKTDRHNDVQEISLSVKHSAGEGSGVSTSAGGAQSTAGESTEYKMTLDRQDIEALGADGRRVLDALARNRPDEATRYLEQALQRADIDVTHRRYTTVSGNVAAERGPEGVSGGGEVTIESAS